MRYLLAAFFFLFSVTAVHAYEVFLTTLESQYEIKEIAYPVSAPNSHLGELMDAPIMYEFEVKEETDISLQLRQLHTGGDPIPFGLMIVQVGHRGSVTEVARHIPETESWQTQKDKTLGIKFWYGDIISEEIKPGTYRVEVSTPVNLGKYMLTLGTGTESAGYFESIGQAYMVQKFFGFSVFKMLTSNVIYYTLGVLLLLIAMYKTWKYRKMISNA